MLRSHRRHAMLLGGRLLLGRRRCGPGGRRGCRPALLGQPRSPPLRGEDPSAPYRPRLWGLDPIGSKPHRRGLRREVLLTPLSSCLGFQIPVQLLTLGRTHALEGPRRSVA